MVAPGGHDYETSAAAMGMTGSPGCLAAGAPVQVVPCDKTWRHDYATCPFAHAGESSERRHPSAYLPFMCGSTQHSTDLKEVRASPPGAPAASAASSACLQQPA